jgi:hypothetical protein
MPLGTAAFFILQNTATLGLAGCSVTVSRWREVFHLQTVCSILAQFLNRKPCAGTAWNLLFYF